MGDRLKEMLAEYGTIALVVYLSIFVPTLLGFAAAIRSGFEVDGAGESAGVWFAAWLATKATQPLRIGATLVLTPIVAKVVHHFFPKKQGENETEAGAENAQGPDAQSVEASQASSVEE